MAQTIAMQRGTGTTSGSASATLFTQSGGLATRVIVNGIILKVASTGTQYWTTINVVSSGAGSIMIAAASWYSAGNQFTPLSTMANVAYSAGGATGPQPRLNLNYDNNQVNNQYVGDTSPNQVGQVNTGIGQGGAIPLNFWIGPGDSILMRNTTSCTYAFSFTTITES
jgi:hypothetical protein